MQRQILPSRSIRPFRQAYPLQQDVNIRVRVIVTHGPLCLQMRLLGRLQTGSSTFYFCSAYSTTSKVRVQCVAPGHTIQHPLRVLAPPRPHRRVLPQDRQYNGRLLALPALPVLLRQPQEGGGPSCGLRATHVPFGVDLRAADRAAEPPHGARGRRRP